MTEIYQNGPVQVVFKVYEDFFMYKSGIYKPSENAVGNETIYHSVKLLGWGTENNVDYWVYFNLKILWKLMKIDYLLSLDRC